ncbi:histone-lysine N-methyltransferase, H3 lysine-9 specific SUVH5-like [Phragmites australis]|uniref:histone-lysine N-methyltransferase, H3 lysine-9 specific SUVH5-like n=1 Tax=Phragmites australis TaxID=29695 RepID=UPI002D7931BE|nr:histone-lysine N-methyltransferase, H3 lysine-9 specific SUVH5-like [Phragmites australis]
MISEGSGESEQRRRRWMEMGAAVVPPRAAGPRRYKALASWRFQPGFVRQPVKHAAAEPDGGSGGLAGGVPEAKFCGSGAAPSGGKSGGVGGGKRHLKRCIRSQSAKSPDAEDVENGGRPGTGNACDLGKSSAFSGVEGLEGTGNSGGVGVGVGAGEDCNSGRFNCNGSVKDTDEQDLRGAASGSGGFDGKASEPEGVGSNVGVEKCIPEGLKMSVDGTGPKSNGSSASDRKLEDPEGSVGLGDFPCHTAKGCSTGDGAAKESDTAAKGCSPAGPGSNGNETYYRKGRKVVVPWRFQVGYKRSFSKAFGSDNGSPDLPAYKVEDRSAKCTPATRSTVRCYASAHSGVRVSATHGFSSVKGEKETGTADKKRKTNNDDRDKVIPNNSGVITRESVMQSLQDFRLIYRDLLDEQDSLREAVLNLRPDLQAYRIFRERFSIECDDKKYVGSVPGIHAGDIFHLRVELCVVGLHRPHRVGIDYIKKDDGTCVAISIVLYAQSSEMKNNFDVLVYSGSVAVTGNQKIEGTNLALKKSMDTNTPVRVIHGFTTHFNGNCGKKRFPTYIYGGLYLVEKYWRERECEDRYVYMFRLRRMEGQKHIDIKEILQTGKAGSCDSIIIKDLSQGLEKIPISVVNAISDEYPMPYRYISRLRYPHNYQPTPPAGCGCVGGCSDSKKCACAVKNGGEIPFNDKGRIIEAKPLVYECGPSCKCPPTCHNRVGQHGMKFRLQVFKTKSMGWGVRTLDFIPSGSFVCEYIGEVLEDEEAQKRTTDEYLFAIGHNYYDESLWEGLSRSIPSLQKGPDIDDEAGFAVDASEMGNFAKFINHSCTPNLYAQNVLYDHDDKSVPHIMFFACDDIRPRQELAYHYNYTIDQVHDANGNIKKKKCLCGSVECDGWLY